MTEVEIAIHKYLYDYVQRTVYKGWECEVNTHANNKRVTIHLLLKKGGEVLASVGEYKTEWSASILPVIFEEMIEEVEAPLKH